MPTRGVETKETRTASHLTLLGRRRIPCHPARRAPNARATRPPKLFKNGTNKEPGSMSAVVSGEPAVPASSDNTKSGCGWPSFTKPIEPGPMSVICATHRWVDRIRRSERSAQRLQWQKPSGAVTIFPDGPSRQRAPGLRYCIIPPRCAFIHRGRHCKHAGLI